MNPIETIKNTFDLMKHRGYSVVKDNRLVRASRYQMTLKEQKIVCYICSIINPNHIDPVTHQPVVDYQFDINSFIKVCGLARNGRSYREIKAMLKKIRDTSIWIETEDGKSITAAWINSVVMNEKSGKVTITLDSNMLPFLFNLSKYVEYELVNILRLNSVYGIRLFELFKSYAYSGRGFTISVSELRSLLLLEHAYPSFKDFRKNVLDKPIAEINKYTDITVDYTLNKVGRNVDSITFSVRNKSSVELLEKESAIP